MALWRVEGWDTFAHHDYPIGEYQSEEEARASAAVALARIQSQSSAGGPPEQGGIEDMVFVVRPDGTKYRFEGLKKA